MSYNYHIYIDPSENYTLEDVKTVLTDFQFAETDESKIIVSFDGWKLWIELNSDDAVAEEATEISTLFNKSKIEDSVSRLEIYSEDDENEEHYNNQLYVLEAISQLIVGGGILDNTIGEFIFEENLLRNIEIDTDFLESVPGNEKIENYINEVNGENTHSWRYWHQLGFEYGNAEKLDLALKCYEISVLLNPQNEAAFYNTGKDNFRAGNYEKSKEYYLKSLEISPEYTTALEGLAQLHARQNKMEEAFEYLRRSLDIDPDHVISNTNMAYYLLKTGKANEGLSFAEHAFALGSIYVSAFNLGHIHLAQGNLDKAIEFYAISLRASQSQDNFWSDFNADFNIVSQYGISLESYNGLKSKIIDQLEILPPLQLNEIANKMSNCKKYLRTPLNEEKVMILEALEVPESYINWLSILNTSYDTRSLSSDPDYQGIYFKNYDDLLVYAYEECFTSLAANGFVGFADKADFSGYVFDARDNSIREINYELFYKALGEGKLESDSENVKANLEAVFTSRRFETLEDLFYFELKELNML